MFSLQVKRYIGNTYAEGTGPFIFEFVRNIWRVYGFREFTVSNIQHTTLPSFNERGLYIFCIENGSDKYPFYVGVAGRTFRQRFIEHQNSGFIHWYNLACSGFPQKVPYHQRHQYPLNAICVPLSYPVAKFIESVFLSHFEFYLNTEENGSIKVNTEPNPQCQVYQSRGSFNFIFGNLMTEVGPIFSSYQNWNG